MKTSQKLLIVLTLVFGAFVSGLFVGRNLNRTPVQIQALPAAVAPAKSAPESALMMRLRTGKFQPLGGVPGGYSVRIAP